MLTFMNSKLRWLVKTSKTTFSKKVNPMKYKYISQNSSAPFHRVTFDHSMSWVLFIDKPNESYQNSEKIERNAISTTKKSFWKEKEMVLH